MIFSRVYLVPFLVSFVVAALGLYRFRDIGRRVHVMGAANVWLACGLLIYSVQFNMPHFVLYSLLLTLLSPYTAQVWRYLSGLRILP